MMSKLKLNYYRAEDEMLIMERIQWRKEEEERRKGRLQRRSLLSSGPLRIRSGGKREKKLETNRCKQYWERKEMDSVQKIRLRKC